MPYCLQKLSASDKCVHKMQSNSLEPDQAALKQHSDKDQHVLQF